MIQGVSSISWEDKTETAPVVLTMIMMPLSYSIATGIGFGFISWVLIKALAGRWTDLNPTVIALGLLFILKFIIL